MFSIYWWSIISLTSLTFILKNFVTFVFGALIFIHCFCPAWFTLSIIRFTICNYHFIICVIYYIGSLTIDLQPHFINFCFFHNFLYTLNNSEESEWPSQVFSKHFAFVFVNAGSLLTTDFHHVYFPKYSNKLFLINSVESFFHNQ